MPVHNIVVGQRVDEVKQQRAKELRREMTPAERLLWQRLRGNRLHKLHFRRQQVIGGFIVDFYCHAAVLIVEVDGPIHEEQAAYDAERDRILSQHGFRTLRFTNEQVMANMEQVLEAIAKAAVMT